MLKLIGVETFYGKIKALHGVSMAVNEGQLVCLLGANGAGKTTILKTIFGIVEPEYGTIHFNDKRIDRKDPEEIIKLGISHVPENRRVFPELTVYENLMMGGFLIKDKDLFEKRFKKITDYFPVLLNRSNQQAGTLSGGEQQMLAIARALMLKPKLLLLDEPSLGLSPKLVQEIFSIIKDLHQSGVTILLVEQNVNHALKTTIWKKQDGLWKGLTWQQYGKFSQDIGNGLLASGVKKGDKISILSQTRPEWVMCDMGIICIGCVTAPIYHSNTNNQVFYIANQSDSIFAFVEDQEQLDKMLAIWDRLPNIKKIVVLDQYHPSNLPNVYSLDQFLELGREYGKKHPDQFEELIDTCQPDEVISFTYTSGTTGNPKAAIFTSRNIIASSKHLPDATGLNSEDLYVSYLPLAHIAERLIGHFLRFLVGNPTVFAESMEDMPQNIRQTGPTVVFGTPRVWEKFYSKILTGIDDATSLGNSYW